MKQEICIDARMAASSGIGTYIRALLSRMKETFSFRLIIDEKVLSQYPELRAFECILSKAPIYSIQEQLELPLLIPKCDLFWSPHFNIPLLPIRAKKRLATIHDVFFLACPEFVGFAKRVYAKLFFHAALKMSDHVITDSLFTLSEIEKYIGSYQNKITTILLGVDSHLSNLSPKPIDVPKKYILYVGNLAPHKNISTLIQSLDFLPLDIHLVLVGKESKWDAWKQEAEKRKDRVTVCGKVSEEHLLWLYKNALMLVHPSFYEGFGFTPLEAMSLGCPTVVSRIASLPEVCGDAAFYVDPSFPEGIAKGVLSVLNDDSLRETLRQKGLQRVTLFDWDVSAALHIDVISRLLSSAKF